MACCLAFGGFASPASAKPIVVTTLTDTADLPFNADGPCGTGTVSDLPGADGLISLREAIIVTNNTNGDQAVTFDSSLSGGIIVVNFDDLDGDTNPDPLPALCGGHTHINGDLDGDDENAWKHAAEWKLKIPASAVGRRVTLSIDYVADAVRLYNGDSLVADNYYNGNVFNVGLWRIPAAQWPALRVKLLPFSPKLLDRLPAEVQVKISDETNPPRNQANVTAAELLEVRLQLATQ